MHFINIGLTLCMINAIYASPYDDGRYRPRNGYDDGKYYRPLGEGKYIPGDEGRYTYIYRHGLYPSDDGDYRYIHEEGPRGPDGPPGFPGGYYLGHKIYAEKYKHVNLGPWANQLVDKYVPYNDNAYNAEQSGYYYDRINVGDEDARKRNCTVYWDGFNPYSNLEKGGRLVSLYNIKGEKKINAVTQDYSKKLRYVYHIFVTVYEED